MDITKNWKDARLESRLDYEGELITHLYNLDEIKINAKELVKRKEKTYDRMSDLREKLGEDVYKEVKEKVDVYRATINSVKQDNTGELVQLFYSILYGELLKYEKR